MNDSSIPLPDKKPGSRLFFAYVLLAAVLLTILCSSLTAVAIRGIDDILSILAEDDPGLSDFAFVFSSLDKAVLEVHALIPALLAFVFTLGVGFLLRSGHRKGGARFVISIVLSVPVGLILFTVSLLVSILLTEVNDIRFADLLLSLSKNLDGLLSLL